MTVGGAFRSALAVLLAMVFITVGVEALEWTMVTAIHQAPTQDPEIYFGIRNGPVFLVVKLLYNAAAAVGGGYLAARVAKQSEMLVGLGLALIQGLALIWAAFQPDLNQWAPAWLFPTLAFLTVVGILYGAHLAAKRRRRVEAVDSGQA